MTTEGDNPAELPADRAAESAAINPYQAPAYHPDDAGDEGRAEEDNAPGPVFWLTAAVLITLGFLTIGLTGGIALPLPVALMGGTVRASVMYARQKQLKQGRVPSLVLLFTSSLVTLLLMISCAFAFGIVCTGGVLVSGINASSYGIFIWTVLSGLAALAAFALMYIQSMKWGA